MADEPLHNPHDKLFKAGFSDPATAGGFSPRATATGHFRAH